MVSESPEAAKSGGAPSSSDNNSSSDIKKYRCLVVDSGPIIRVGMSTLWNAADSFYTVPAVLQEIRDTKAREHLANLPIDLIQREPSPDAISAVVEFSKQTGDYQSLSSVDLQVLGLLYDLEREGCHGDMSHVRNTPKRVLGLGKIETLGGGGGGGDGPETSATMAATDSGSEPRGQELADPESSDDEDISSDEEEVDRAFPRGSQQQTAAAAQNKPSSWAKIVDPTACDTTPIIAATEQSNILEQKDADSIGGQFSDAEDDDEVPAGDDGDGENGHCGDAATVSVEDELAMDFPSLTSSLTVPYEGSDNEEQETGNIDTIEEGLDEKLRLQQEKEEARKQEALKPVTKSGKLYNSFRKYGDLMKPKPQPAKNDDSSLPLPTGAVVEESASTAVQDPSNDSPPSLEEENNNKNQSRIIGGGTLAGQGADVEDDGEGWITCTHDIRKMKAAGSLDPKRDPKHVSSEGGASAAVQPVGPPMSQRAAVATTDFAMQNVVLQMGLELLSVDGMKVRKLKSWVTRCGACFKVYTSAENNNAGPLGSKRLFCGHCGSDMMQRIAASVDGKTGRLRLHLSKKYRHNLRGTKFSLPKPGTGNRFQGDLLLREDQLLMGAWNQKVKMRSGGKAQSAAQSMFGKDLATNVGCHTKSSNLDIDDIKVGFGRRNPNAAKGRERRGKKKKSADRACGMRRY